VGPQNQIGSFREFVDASAEYARLAREDEAAANTLAEAGHYRQAVYFVVQAMEKHLRAKIFAVSDPANEEVRQANRNHSVEAAASFLVGTLVASERLHQLVQEQFERCLFQGLRYNLLHNDLRYPTYFERTHGFACLEVSRSDVIEMFARLDWLKDFMQELNLLV
jgi:hypothetical protein